MFRVAFKGDAFGQVMIQVMIFDHVSDVQVFHGNQAGDVHQRRLPACGILVQEVLALVIDFCI